MKRILIPFFTIALLFFINERSANALIAIGCPDLAGVDFGDCATPLGIAQINGECIPISGCGTVDTNGYEYSYYIYPDILLCVTNCIASPFVCVDTNLLALDIPCDDVYEPVCGCNEVTYSNACEATIVGGVTWYSAGECPPPPPCNVFPTSQEDLGWADDLDMMYHQLTMQYFNGEFVYFYEVCSPILSDGMNILFDCNGNEICMSGGEAGYYFENCPDFVPSNDYIVIPCSAELNCSWENPLTDYPFLTELIDQYSDGPLCNTEECEVALHMVEFGGVISFLLDINCDYIADIPDEMYDCEGNIICLQNGETGPPYCLGEVTYYIIETLWTCSGGITPNEDMMGMDLSLKVFLEGPMNDVGSMNMMDPAILMGGHPYGAAPYYYEGPELTGMIPANAVDYVLIELQEDFGMEPAAQQVAFVLSNGDIVLEDGTFPYFLVEASKTYQVWLRHHNHLDIVSNAPITPAPMVVQNFLDLNDAMGPQQLKDFGYGFYVMYAGDINSDGVINVGDYDDWALTPAVIGQYLQTDTNLDGVVQAIDYDYWFENKAKIGFAQNQD